ncbi:UNVERIFIED_CONTAM: hypothetical protein HDU68_007502 [Siphonaria sp. JEL0065]|nr:hypothetical protein HDU68_007502 [Siphonaria sp. JEL0065]
MGEEHVANTRDWSRLPVVVFFSLGLLCSGGLLFTLLLRGGKFVRTSLGRLALSILLCLVVIDTVLIVMSGYQVMYAGWLDETVWAKEFFGAFLYTLGVLVSFVNLVIAMERYWLICKGENLGYRRVIPAAVHMIVTIIPMIWAFVSSEPKSYKLPGGSLQQNVCLGFVVQYMVVAFGGIGFLYFKCYHEVNESVRGVSHLATIAPHDLILKKRVITNCLLMVASFIGCYGLFPATTVYLYFVPDWEEETSLDVASLCLVAMDGIITPLIIVHLNRDLAIGTFVGTKSDETRDSRYSKSKGIKSEALSAHTRSFQ